MQTLQATYAFCIADHQVVTSAGPTMDARVPRTCQNSCCYMQIDILHAEDYLQHIRWTRRRHDLEQSIPILCGHGPAATLSLKSLDQLNSIYTVHGLQ